MWMIDIVIKKQHICGGTFGKNNNPGVVGVVLRRLFILIQLVRLVSIFNLRTFIELV